MRTLGFRELARLAGLLALAVGVAAASAQSYPDKPVKLIVPYAAGGFSDVLGRSLAQWLTQSLGQPVVRVHPETGRKVLYVSEGITTHIAGLTPAESRPIL